MAHPLSTYPALLDGVKWPWWVVETEEPLNWLTTTEKHVSRYFYVTTQQRCQCIAASVVKGMVLYSAVSSPLDRSKRFTLSSPGRPVHSDTVLGFSWKHSSHAAIAQRLFTHISTTVYSQVLIYTAESRLRRREMKENAQTSKRYQRGFEPGLSRLRVRHSTN